MAEVKITREDYPNNSIVNRVKPPEDKEPLQKVTTGSVSVQKDTLGQKFKKLFMPGDFKSAGKYALNNVVMPSIKMAFLSAIEMMLTGQVTNRSWGAWSRPTTSQTNYSYTSSSGVRVVNQPLTMSRQQRESFAFANLVFNNYTDATNVIDNMCIALEDRGYLTVADFYVLCGVQTQPTDHDWGWRKLNKAEPRRVSDGYILDIQPPIYLR